MHDSIKLWYGNKFVSKGHNEKKMQKGWSSTFLKKLVEFLGLLFFPWKLWTRQSFIPGNPAKLYDNSWEWNQVICDFFFIVLENASYLLFNPRTFYFFNIPGIANFVTSVEETNYWSWDTRENNLEYFPFGISISLLASYVHNFLYFLYELATSRKLWSLPSFIQVSEVLGN